MVFDRTDIALAVEANVEDFYGDPEVEPDEIPQMAVEDAFNAYGVTGRMQDELWGRHDGGSTQPVQLDALSRPWRGCLKWMTF